MTQKIILGIVVSALLGIFITSFFVPNGTSLQELFLTKITATCIVTGFFCGIYGSLSKSRLQIFLVSTIIGIVVFYVKYLVTGHHFSPLTMGAFAGSILGGIFAMVRDLTHKYHVYKRFQRIKRRDLKTY